jgi:hypothetical protein
LPERPAGAWAWSAWNAPRLDNVPFKQLPRAEQQKRREDVQELSSQVREVERAAKAGEKKPFALEVTDEQLNTLLQDRIDLSKFPIRNLRVGFEPERIVAQGDVEYKGFTTKATIEGTVELHDGALVYKTESLEAGVLAGAALPMPGNLKEKIDTQVNRQLARALKAAPGRIDEVRLEQGKMVVSGQTD